MQHVLRYASPAQPLLHDTMHNNVRCSWKPVMFLCLLISLGFAMLSGLPRRNHLIHQDPAATFNLAWQHAKQAKTHQPTRGWQLKQPTRSWPFTQDLRLRGLNAQATGLRGAESKESAGAQRTMNEKMKAASHDIHSAVHGFVKHWTHTEDLQRMLLKAMNHTFGPEHPDTLATKSSLALILQAKGDLKSVEELQRDVLEARTRTLGPDSPDTIASKNSLSRVLIHRGDQPSASKLNREVREAISRTELKDDEAALPMADHSPEAEPLSPAIVNLNKALVETIKGAIDAMYHGRDMQRFYVLETVARVPYFAYMSCLHMLETLGKRGNTERLRLHYAEADNELHHLLIMEALGGNNAYIDRFFAQHIAVFYYWYVVAIYLLHPRAAYHLSELIEDHAFHTYDAFLHENAEDLRKQPVPDIAKEYYSGRDMLEVYLRGSDCVQTLRADLDECLLQTPPTLNNLYDVFVAIRDDEKAHWNTLSNLVRQKDVAV